MDNYTEISPSIGGHCIADHTSHKNTESPNISIRIESIKTTSIGKC